jgi:hypothetical protein|nr:hypothetical protein [uncultured Schaedlerella sp.]
MIASEITKTIKTTKTKKMVARKRFCGIKPEGAQMRRIYHAE